MRRVWDSLIYREIIIKVVIQIQHSVLLKII